MLYMCALLSLNYLSDVPVVADLSHWLGCNRTATTNHGNLWNGAKECILEKHIQGISSSALQRVIWLI